MTLIDWIILFIIAIGAFKGFVKGFFNQLGSIVGFIAGLIAAKALYAALAEKLFPVVTNSMTVAQIISFLAIWLIVPIIFNIIALFLTKTAEAIALGGVNRLLGLFLGTLKNFVIVMLLISLIEYIDTSNVILSQTKKVDSVLYYPIRSVAGAFFPVAKNVSKQYIFK
ncbi:CvpA family protein [uncultured Bacteroides sp.]|uniref:CvpA family protein n=1 Tax=uncultured Bacteroides sp. TaxID=162156 RepID=UPI002AAA67E2|nr:CvpA family protein [uncultured Bacteroides sp.]